MLTINPELQGKFFEAVCQSIDPEEKSIVACFPEDAGMERACFKVYYDYLVLGNPQTLNPKP